MPKTLTLSEPAIFEKTAFGVRTVKWTLLDEEGDGYLISWIERAFDTMKPECLAFPAEHIQSDVKKMDWRKISWNEQAVSHNPDAALALNEVLARLGEKHGYTYGINPGCAQLMRGEVVADGNR